ncbi:MAG TPA: DUF4097 family beta strand repeat-containing protein [Vicinamibacterales bacterium]|nr:DUF4097 family beta strand repeat-containing protein [Vicinamibacterales bacterium]
MLPAAPAGAQPDPGHIRSITRSIVREAIESVRLERYQRDRDRGEQREEQTERFTRTLRIGAAGEVDVSNVAGDIVVSRGGGENVTIEVIKTARARTVEDAREALKFVQVDVTDRPGRAEARARYPRSQDIPARFRRNLSVSVEYRISAPEAARVTARSISGDITVRDIRGDLTLDTVSGDIQIANAARIPMAKTISGDVEIADTKIEGTLGASTVSGTLLLRRVQATRLDLSTISGDVTLVDVDCNRIDGQTVSGEVQLSGALARGGRYELRSHSGEVRVAVSGTTGFELEASSFSGSVRSDFELTLRGSDTGRGRRQRAIRGTFGDGSAVLSLSTFSGDIIVSKR